MDNNRAPDRRVTPRDDEQKILERLSRKGPSKDKNRQRPNRYVVLEWVVALAFIGCMSLGIASQGDHDLVNSIASVVTALAFGGALGTLCIWTLFKVIQKMRPKLPLAWRWLILRRDNLSAAHKIILAVGVPMILICLMFLVSVPTIETTYWRHNPTGYRWTAARANYLPIYWLGMTLIVSGFEWFLWGKPRDEPPIPPPSDAT